MTEEEGQAFVYILYVRMCQVDVFDMIDPLSRANHEANTLLDLCSDDMLREIYRAKVPWLATRALGRLIQRQQSRE